MAQEKDKGSVFSRMGHFLIQRWVISGIGALALALLLWFLGPLLAFMAGVVVRLAFVAIIAVVWLIANLVLDLRAARRNTAMARSCPATSSSRIRAGDPTTTGPLPSQVRPLSADRFVAPGAAGGRAVRFRAWAWGNTRRSGIFR